MCYGVTRKRKAQQAFAILKPVWRCKSLSTSTKLRIFNSKVKSVLLYGSETLKLTTASISVLQGMDRCLRKSYELSGQTKSENQQQRLLEENVARANRPNNNNKKMEMDWTHVEKRQLQRNKTRTRL